MQFKTRRQRQKRAYLGEPATVEKGIYCVFQGNPASQGHSEAQRALMGGGMAGTTFQWLEPHARSFLRIIAGFTFSLHGLQKLFGLFGGMGGSGAHAPFLSLPWVAGFLEAFGGALIILGLFTVPVAFILSGEMAVAYFMVHMPKGFWPIRNGGELAALYSFIFLYFFSAGPGPWSFDRWFRKKSK